MTQKTTRAMTPQRRALFFRVLADYQPVEELLPILQHLDAFRRCDEMLAWLIANRITGKQLHLWMAFQHQRSMLKMAAYILQRLNRDPAPKPILVGVDYLVDRRAPA